GACPPIPNPGSLFFTIFYVIIKERSCHDNRKPDTRIPTAPATSGHARRPAAHAGRRARIAAEPGHDPGRGPVGRDRRGPVACQRTASTAWLPACGGAGPGRRRGEAPVPRWRV